MVDIDPQGPKFHIMKFDSGETRPLTRSFFQCPDFLITRTYCCTKKEFKLPPNGLRIRNNLFSDSHGDLLRHWHVEVRDRDDEGQPMPQDWRRGFWQGERPWEQKGPKPGDINELVRRRLAQKQARPPQQNDADNEVDVLLSRAAARLQKAATKKHRQAEALKAHSDSEPGSSSFLLLRHPALQASDFCINVKKTCVGARVGSFLSYSGA